MKWSSASVHLLLVFLVASCGCKTQGEISNAKENFFGLEPPGSTPKVFAPGIVNTDDFEEMEGMFATDMKIFYFIRGGGRDDSYSLIAVEYKNNQWQESVVKQGVSEPSISPDGRTIYLKSECMERTSTGWSELRSLGAPFESIDIMRLSASSSGTYYFDTYSEKLDVPLRSSRSIDGKYEPPKSMGQQFAVGRYNAHPFIAPDESYIVWDSMREGGYGMSDLYISFRLADGSWGSAINLGNRINTASAENYPSVSPDGRFLFFDRRARSADNSELDIFWVDAQFIETL